MSTAEHLSREEIPSSALAIIGWVATSFPCLYLPLALPISSSLDQKKTLRNGNKRAANPGPSPREIHALTNMPITFLVLLAISFKF